MIGISGETDGVESRLGRAIRQWRIESGLTQDALADRASLSRSAVQQLERGEGSRIETLVRVLRALERIDALDAFTPRDGPSPIEQLAAQRRMRSSAAPRARRKG